MPATGTSAFRPTHRGGAVPLRGRSSGEIEFEEDRLGGGDICHSQFLSVRQTQLCRGTRQRSSSVTAAVDSQSDCSPFKVLQRFGRVRSSMDLTVWKENGRHGGVTKGICVDTEHGHLPANTGSYSFLPEWWWSLEISFAWKETSVGEGFSADVTSEKQMVAVVSCEMSVKHYISHDPHVPFVPLGLSGGFTNRWVNIRPA